MAAAAAVAYALTTAPEARPPVAAPPVSSAPATPKPAPAAPVPAPVPTPLPTPPAPKPTPPPTHAPKPTPRPSAKPTPTPTPVPAPVPTLPPIPTPPPKPTPPPVPTPPIVPPPSVPVPTPPVPTLTSYWLDSLPFSKGSQRVPPAGPSIDASASDWLWQRQALSMGGTDYRRGISMAVPSSVTLDLNRPCTSYDAVAGVDDITPATGGVVFSVTGDGDRTLWTSPRLAAGATPVAVHVPLAGQHSIRLVVRSADGLWWAGALGDWADARFTC